MPCMSASGVSKSTSLNANAEFRNGLPSRHVIRAQHLLIKDCHKRNIHEDSSVFGIKMLVRFEN